MSEADRNTVAVDMTSGSTNYDLFVSQVNFTSATKRTIVLTKTR